MCNPFFSWKKEKKLYLCSITNDSYMKNILLILCAPFLSLAANSQALTETDSDETKTVLERVTGKEQSLSGHMNLLLNSMGSALFTDGELDCARFSINGVRMVIHGNFHEKFSYYFRQSYTRNFAPMETDNVSMALEQMILGWKPNSTIALEIGKQCMQLGGYEYWVAANRVRFYSDFNSTMTSYQTGVNMAISPHPNHTVNLQFLNNRASMEEDYYPFGLPEGKELTKAPFIGVLNYDGYLIDRALNLRYAVAAAPLTKGRPQVFVTAGNTWEKGPVLAYLDIMYAYEGIDTKGLISNLSANRPEGGVTAQYASYLSTIANFDYRIHAHWNLYLKGAYETTRVLRSNACYQKGLYTRTWSAQACAEYFPIKGEDFRVFLHLLYKRSGATHHARALGATDHDSQRISIGMEYKIPVF